MSTLDTTLDDIMNLSPEERETLVEILMKRRIEERRKEISNQVKETEALYNQGKLEPRSAQEIIDELHASLENE